MMMRIGTCTAVLFLLVIAGCAGIGADLSAEKIQAVAPGHMTKSQLFDLLRSSPNAVEPDDPAYTLFPQAEESDRVYVFEHTFSYSYPLPFFIYWGAHYVTKTDRLWALVNEKTGIVEAYAFKQFGEPVAFRGSGFPAPRSGRLQKPGPSSLQTERDHN